MSLACPFVICFCNSCYRGGRDIWKNQHKKLQEKFVLGICITENFHLSLFYIINRYYFHNCRKPTHSHKLFFINKVAGIEGFHVLVHSSKIPQQPQAKVQEIPTRSLRQVAETQSPEPLPLRPRTYIDWKAELGAEPSSESRYPNVASIHLHNHNH